MSARLDPRTKQQIKFALIRAMYASTERRSNKLRDIITDNCTKVGYGHQSFSYKGKYYSLELVAPRYKNQRLMSKLHASMDAYLTESNTYRSHREALYYWLLHQDAQYQ